MIKFDNYLDLFLRLGFLFLPIGLIAGPAIPDFIIILSSIIFIFKLNKKYLTEYKLIISFFLIFYTFNIFSSLLSDNVLFSLKSSIFYIRFFIYVFVISYIVEKTPGIIKQLLYVLSIILTLLLIDTLIQFIIGKNILGYPAADNGHRLASFFKDEYILGSYTLKIFPLALFCLQFLNLNQRLKNYSSVLIFGISGIIIILSGDRAPLYLFFIFCLLFLILTDNKKFYIFFGSIVCTILIFFILTNQPLKKRIIDQTIIELGLTEKKAGYNFEKNGIFIFSPHHEKLISTGFNMWKKNKYFGVGPNNFRNNCEKITYKDGGEIFRCNNHPHNLYVQLLSETGIIPFVILVLLFFVIVSYYVKYFILFNINKKSSIDYSEFILIILAIINLWPLTTNGNFFNNYLNLQMILAFGFLLSQKKNFKYI